MVKPHVLERVRGGGASRKEISYVGREGERCADCVRWRKTSVAVVNKETVDRSKFAGPGEGPCSKDGNKETWGGALCPDFIAR